ncbi:putative tail spike protein [Erwinia phage Gungnir39]|nr:putative tail spike protein [Erwinia phage Gungnir39]
MTTYNTGNPLGSSAAKDLYDNAEVLDKLINGAPLSVQGRLGKALKSWSGIETKFDLIVSSLDTASFTFPSEAAGLAGTSNGQYFRVPQGASSTASFNYYRNNNGSAILVARTTGAFDESLNGLVPLAKTTSFRMTGSGSDEVEVDSKYAYILTDSGDNMIYCIYDGSFLFYTPLEVPQLTTKKIIVDGKEIDLSSVVPPDVAENVINLSSTTKFSSGVAGSDDFEREDDYLIVDADDNICFSLKEYIALYNEMAGIGDRVSSLEKRAVSQINAYSEKDNAGNYQVHVLLDGGLIDRKITDTASNETDVRPQGSEMIVWKSDRDDLPPGGMFYAKSPDFEPYPYVARSRIVGWGDSFMENNAFLNKVSSLSGLYTYNFGKSSQSSSGVAAKQGGSRAFYVPTGGFIPASGSVTLSPARPGPLAAFGWAAMAGISVTYAGVAGVFSWDGTSATFTRSASGNSVPVINPEAIVVIPTTTQAVRNGAPRDTVYLANDECINLIWMGRNNISQTESIVNDYKGMVDFLKPYGKRFVVLPAFMGASEGIGTANYLNVINANKALQEAFPENYCQIDGVDLLQNFKNHYNPGFDGDVEDISNGVTPRTLRYDWLHPAQTINNSLSPENALYVGADVNGEFVYNFMKSKGWVK